MNIEDTYGGKKSGPEPVPAGKSKLEMKVKADLTPVTEKPVEEQKSDAKHSKTEQAREVRKAAASVDAGRKLPGELRQILFDQDVAANPKMNYRTPVTEFLQKYGETFMRMDLKRLAEMVEVVIRGGFTLEEKASVHKDLTFEQTKLIEVATPEEMGCWEDSTLRELAFYQKLMVELDLQQQNQLLRAIEQRLAG